MKTPAILESIRPTLLHRCNLALLDYLASLEPRRAVIIQGQEYLPLRGSEEWDEMLLPLRERGRAEPPFDCSPEICVRSVAAPPRRASAFRSIRLFPSASL